MYVKAYAMEEDLVCVDADEFKERVKYFMDKWEIINMIHNSSKGSFIRKIAENHYILFYKYDENYDPLHIICPLYARDEVKKWWKELQILFQQYE